MPPVDPAPSCTLPSWPLAVALAAVLASGCLDNPGVDPQPQQLNFPTAIETSPQRFEGGEPIGPEFLYVANSNFDLRYNAGSVQAYNLEALASCDDCRVADDCVSIPEGLDASQDDGPLVQRPCPGLLSSEVFIDSFASDLERNPGDDRLYVPVRSRSSLTYVDNEGVGGALSCGGSDTPHECIDEFRRGDEAVANDRNLDLPADPTGVQVGNLADFDPEGRCFDAPPEGEVVLVSHRGGQVSLFLEQPTLAGGAPALVDVGTDFPDNLVGLEVNPLTSFAWLSSASALGVGRAGVALDCNNPARSVLFNDGTMPLRGVDTGGAGFGDTRAIRFDPRIDDPVNPVPRAYVLSRRPEALLVVDAVESGPGGLAIEEVIDVCVGPSRLDVGAVQDPEGDDHVLGFVSCFNSRDLYIVDLDARRLIAVVREMSGPYELSLDAARNRLYVADFRTSVIRVIDLTPLTECLGSGSMRPARCSPRVTWQIGLERPIVELR